ncbi:hypothetical protein [Leptospira kanakyensis]|uniref:hypothetical protein n=1 Tax=Leptospira kanakyensis TaxID=2484968 RepID=UPI00223CADC0|nr:hypothetical protein [Leptospira kanakyensis]MCW7482145.1 hypothetical protein [Leptospira kanakyensis]
MNTFGYLDVNDRIDKENFHFALIAAKQLANKFLINGRYVAEESWGPEGNLYLAESAWALLDMFRITQEKLYLSAVAAILNELKRIQKPSGGWALELGRSGLAFTVTDEQRRITSEVEDLPPTVATLRTISEYYELCGDDSFMPMGKKAFEYLMDHWDNNYGSFLEKENSPLRKLRSNPRAYHLFSFLGIKYWEKHEPKKIKIILPTILNFIKDTFESFDSETMPLIYGLHVAVLLEHMDMNYIENSIYTRLRKHLMESKFAIGEISGGYGHRDGLRGIVKDEAHIRSACGVAIALKFYDLYTKTDTFRSTKEYRELAQWIIGMCNGKYFNEFQMTSTLQKLGYGSPGQYLPIWWILGRM